MEGQKEQIKTLVNKLLSPLGFSGSILISEEDGRTIVRLESENAGSIIGKGGEHLRALQHLLVLVVSKQLGRHLTPGELQLDVNNYRKDREAYLVSLAKNTAYEVRETKHAQELEPMNSFERRIVHATLTSFDGVKTESVGEHNLRRVVIRPA